MIDSLANQIGNLVLGALLLLTWIGGAIAGSDYLIKNVSKRSGDWFGVLWFVGLPAALIAYLFVK